MSENQIVDNYGFYEAEPASAFFGDRVPGQLADDIGRFTDRIDELLDNYPDFDWRVEKPQELREEERQFLLDCKARLSVMAESLGQMCGAWISYWPT